jgi:hypothetical protein
LDGRKNGGVEEEREEAGTLNDKKRVRQSRRRRKERRGVPVKEGREGCEKGVADEQECHPGKSGGQGEKFGEEEERGSSEIV